MSYDITISIAKGLILVNDRTLSKENGGNIDLTTSWAHSIHQRLGFVHRKFTTCKQPVFPGFLKEVGFSFYHQIDKIVSWCSIPSELIINMDQTPLLFFLVSNYILAPKANKTVLIRNCSDYRQITGTFAISMTGGFLPIQLIYQGKTDCCHPNFAFLEEFHITHTPNHWSLKKNPKSS